MSQINSIGGASAASYIGQSKNNKAASDIDAAISAAKANSAQSTSSQSSVQEVDKKKKPDVVAEYMDYMKKTPAQRLREAILKKLGLTEEDLAKMSPEKRAAVEQKIADMIKQSIEGNDTSSAKDSDLQKLGSSPVQKLSDGLNSVFLQLQQLGTETPTSEET